MGKLKGLAVAFEESESGESISTSQLLRVLADDVEKMETEINDEYDVAINALHDSISVLRELAKTQAGMIHQLRKQLADNGQIPII